MTRNNFSRILIVIAGLIAAGLFKYFDLGQFLTITYLRQSQDHFLALYASHRFGVISGYMFIYIAVTALSLPGAAVMSLAGGALFGLLTGSIVVSFASTIGATIACLVSRFLLREWVQERFGDRLEAINQGISKEGAFYLFSLRLIPIFPFFVINLLLGLTRMRITTFFWVSQLGMLPATIVFVNAGKELAKISSPGDILSPGLFFSFVLLGLFPITVKKTMEIYRNRFLRSKG